MTRDGIRAVVLAAIMVFSVIAVGAGFVGNVAGQEVAQNEVVVLNEEGDPVEGKSFESVQTAVDNAQDGHTVVVGAGTYDGFVVDGVNSLTVTAADGTDPTVEGEIRIGDPSGGTGADGTVLRGFTVVDPDESENFAANNRGVGLASSDNVLIEDLTLKGFKTQISLDFAGETPTNVTVTENTFRDGFAAVGSTENVGDLMIEGNTFDNVVEGVGLGGGVELTADNVSALIDANSFGNLDTETQYAVGDYRGDDIVKYGPNGNLLVQEGDSIQAAVDASESGGVVEVATGMYSEQIEISTSNVTIRGVSEQPPIIEGGIAVKSDGVTVDRLGINGSDTPAVRVELDTTGFRLTNSHLIKNPGDNRHTLLFEGGQTDHLISSNTFENQQDPSNNPILAYVNGDTSVGVSSTNVDFVNNTFTGEALGGGMALGQEATESKISKNTFSATSNFGLVEVYGENVTVEDNAFTPRILTDGAFYLRDFGDNVDRNSLYTNNFNGGVLAGTTGSDSSEVFSTIGDSLETVSDGGTIFLSEGNYTEQVTVDSDLVLKGPNAGVPGDERSASDLSNEAVITTPNNDAVTISNANLTIDGVAFDNNQRFLSVNSGWNAVTLKNSIFTNAKSKIGGHFWFTGDAGNLTFSNNYVVNNSVSNGMRIRVDQGGPAGVNVSDNTWENNDYTAMNINEAHGIIENNKFINTESISGSEWFEGQAGILLAANDNDLIIRENDFDTLNNNGLTIYGNFDGEIEVRHNNFTEINSSAIQVSERQIPEDGLPADSADVKIKYNIFEGNDRTITNNAEDTSLDATLNYFGNTTPTVQGDVTYDPFLTVEPDAVDADSLGETTQFGHDLVVPADGDTHSVAFPAAANGTVGDVFGDFNGTVYAYDGAGWEQGAAIENESIEALDAFAVTLNEDADDQRITFEYADLDGDAPERMTTTELEAGWNFVGAPSSGSPDTAFSVSTTDVARVVNAVGGPTAESTPYGLSGSDEIEPDTVSPFQGYWVFATDDGELGAVVPVGPTQSDEESTLREN